MRIGFIGIGNMGSEMARHLLAGGHRAGDAAIERADGQRLRRTGHRWRDGHDTVNSEDER